MMVMEATMEGKARIIPPQPMEVSRHDLDEAADRISARTGIDAVTARKVLENAAIYREPGSRG
jgi:hypothetical protein